MWDSLPLLGGNLWSFSMKGVGNRFLAAPASHNRVNFLINHNVIIGMQTSGAMLGQVGKLKKAQDAQAGTPVSCTTGTSQPAPDAPPPIIINQSVIWNNAVGTQDSKTRAGQTRNHRGARWPPEPDRNSPWGNQSTHHHACTPPETMWGGGGGRRTTRPRQQPANDHSTAAEHKCKQLACAHPWVDVAILLCTHGSEALVCESPDPAGSRAKAVECAGGRLNQNWNMERRRCCPGPGLAWHGLTAGGDGQRAAPPGTQRCRQCGAWPAVAKAIRMVVGLLLL